MYPRKITAEIWKGLKAERNGPLMTAAKRICPENRFGPFNRLKIKNKNNQNYINY